MESQSNAMWREGDTGGVRKNDGVRNKEKERDLRDRESADREPARGGTYSRFEAAKQKRVLVRMSSRRGAC